MEESQGTTSFDYVSDPAAPSGFESGTGSDIGSVHDPQPDDPSAHPHHPTNPSTSLMVYEPPTSSWTLCRSLAINLLLPFVNGLMLGFGELFAHEAAFWLGWGGTKVFPASRSEARRMGPGIEIRPKNEDRREPDLYTTMEP